MANGQDNFFESYLWDPRLNANGAQAQNQPPSNTASVTGQPLQPSQSTGSSGSMGIAGAPGGPNGTGQIPAGSMPITNPPVNNNTSMSGSNQMQPGMQPPSNPMPIPNAGTNPWTPVGSSNAVAGSWGSVGSPGNSAPRPLLASSLISVSTTPSSSEHLNTRSGGNLSSLSSFQSNASANNPSANLSTSQIVPQNPTIFNYLASLQNPPAQAPAGQRSFAEHSGESASLLSLSSAGSVQNSGLPQNPPNSPTRWPNSAAQFTAGGSQTNAGAAYNPNTGRIPQSFGAYGGFAQPPSVSTGQRFGSAPANPATSAQMSAGQMGRGQMGPGQMSTGQMGPGQMSTGQMNASLMGRGQMGPGQMNAGLMGRGQMGPGQMSAGQMGPGQMSAGQMSAGLMGRGQMGPGQMNAGLMGRQMNAGLMGRGQMGPGQMSAGLMGRGQMGPGQMSAGQMGRGQVTPSLMGDNQMPSASMGGGQTNAAQMNPGQTNQTQGAQGGSNQEDEYLQFNFSEDADNHNFAAPYRRKSSSIASCSPVITLTDTATGKRTSSIAEIKARQNSYPDSGISQADLMPPAMRNQYPYWNQNMSYNPNGYLAPNQVNRFSGQYARQS